jgi:hypothetical protein
MIKSYLIFKRVFKIYTFSSLKKYLELTLKTSFLSLFPTKPQKPLFFHHFCSLHYCQKSLILEICECDRLQIGQVGLSLRCENC